LILINQSLETAIVKIGATESDY